MRTRDPFGMALGSLRGALEHGLAPGRHLPVADIAAALKLSTSPVREALSRLCGEGLIEDRRGLGYFTRVAPQEDIVGLLELEAVHVRLAARAYPDPAPASGSDAVIEVWISRVMDGCDNQPLVESYERVHRRLCAMRRLNGPVNPDPACEIGDGLDAYYDRWRRASGSLSAQLRRLDPGPCEYTINIV